MRQLTPTNILGTPCMAKAMEAWGKWMITRIGGETNGWALDIRQVVGVQQSKWLVRVYRVYWKRKGPTHKRFERY